MTDAPKAPRKPRKDVSWTDVKARLTTVDRAGLLGLLQDMYAARKDNQTFLHSRFSLGDDVLKPYKITIDRWLSPDWIKNKNPSVAKAKKAIADYRKAIGFPEGLAELMVFYCERASFFCDDSCWQEDAYFDALIRMYEQALKTIAGLPEVQRPALWMRLGAAHHVTRNLGYGVCDDLGDLFARDGANG